ncbi:MAG: hypothetical protein K2N03_06185, partial [Muribaculaceae bacterium]|nr:hypothetical protein [Muribaculaceae bacterium]
MNKKNIIYSLMATLLLAVVAILFFIPDVFDGNVLQQHDTLQGIANGQEGKAYYEATGNTTRWTNSLFGGMPNFQIAPSYPANDMVGWIGKVMTLGIPSPGGILFAMMLGFFIMALCFGFSWQVALFGAIGWGFSSYFIIIIGAGHIWKFMTLAYIPPTIGGLALCYRGKYLSGAALTAVFATLQLQSNHPQMTYYFLFLILFLVIGWLVMAVRQNKIKQWGIATGCALASALLAVGVNSASLYNSYEYSKETVRGKATEIVDPKAPASSAEGMDYDAITAWSYGVDETLTLIIPNVKGGATIKPVGGQNYPLSVMDTKYASTTSLSPEEAQVAYSFNQYFGNQPMTNGPVYVGIILLVLAVAAMFVVDAPELAVLKWALFAGMIVSILLSWGDNFPLLTDFFIDHFPGYNKFRAVASMLVVAEFCIPFLAMLCVIQMLRSPEAMRNNAWTINAVAGVAALICLFGCIWPGIFGSPFRADEMRFFSENGILGNPAYSNILNVISESRLSLVRADSLRSLIFLVLGMATVWLYLSGKVKNKTVFAGVLTLLVLIDLFNVDKRYVNHENFVAPSESQSELAMTPADEQILRDKSNYRVMDVSGMGSARSSYFHKTIGGYHAAKLTRYNDLLEHQIRKNNPNVLNMLNTKYFIVDGEVIENPEALGNAWFVEDVAYLNTPNEEMDALTNLKVATHAVADKKFRDVLGTGAVKTPGDTTYETSYAPDKLEYTA